MFKQAQKIVFTPRGTVLLERNIEERKISTTEKLSRNVDSLKLATSKTNLWAYVVACSYYITTSANVLIFKPVPG
jgi:hypothetical protein